MTVVIAVVSTAIALTVFGGPAQAVHDTGAFELDGNATNGAATPGDDWDNVCHQVSPTACPTPANTSGATAVSWTPELNLNASIFTGGGSKDPQNVTNWAWKDGAGGLPDKDNLLHSFAARYSLTPDASTCPSGSAPTCEVIYFGSDRYDNSGDAQQGFWFFQKQIGLGTNSIGGGTGFTGTHTLGDLLVISDFSNGGTTSTITVFKWNPACTADNTNQNPPPALLCGDANLQLLATSANAKCSAALPGTDAFCGIVNPTNGTVAPWSFTDKSGFHTYLNGEFYEGGINLSTLGLGNECFSSVLSETRASTSTTATLKDFVLGQFASCSATLTTTPSVGAGTQVLPGQSVNDIATVQGLGTGSPPTPTGNVTFHMCGPTDPSSTATCDTGGALVSTNALTDSSPPAGEAQATSDNVNTAASPLAAGRYCFRADWPGDSNYIQQGGFSHSGTGNSECFIVQQLATTTVTTPSVGAGPVAVGTSVTDHAVVTGTAAGGTPTGTINFFVCNPTQVATNGGTCSTGGTAAGSKTAVAGPGANQSQADSDAVTASSVGTWCFRAVYVPDTNVYTGSQDASTGECFLVQDSSSASSEQDWLPNDTAHVATAGGTALNGTLTIALHLTSDCSGPVVTGQSYSSTLTNAASPVTRSTSNTTFLVKSDATVSWSVDFVPTAGSNVTGSSHCETSTVTITN